MEIKLKEVFTEDDIDYGDLIIFIDDRQCLVVKDEDEDNYCLIELKDYYIVGFFGWSELLWYLSNSKVKRIIKGKNLELKEV